VERARQAIAEGRSAIADAVFANEGDREAVESVAREAGVPFLGIWLEAPAQVCIDRVEHRSGDPSDARAEVVRAQATQGSGPLHWHRLDASRGEEEVTHAARILLDELADSLRP
jgi:predicted kinase